MKKIKDFVSIPLTICFAGLTLLHFNFKESQVKEMAKLNSKIDSLQLQINQLKLKNLN